MKNKLLKKILTLTMVAAMLLGCVGMLAGCGDKDPFANLTDAEYMKAVEKANMAGAIDGLTEFYDALGKTDTKLETNVKVDYTVQIGDMIIDMLEQSYQQSEGSAMDFSFLSNIGLQLEVAAKDNLMKENLAVLLGNKKVISAVALLDMAKYVEYMAIPELNDDFIKIDMGEMMGDDITAADIVAKLPEIMAKLPSAETLETLLNRYIDVVLDNLKNVTRSTVTLEEGELKQECTAVTVKLYLADVIEIVEKLVDTAKNDQDLKKVVDGISELAGKDLYPDFQQALEDFRKGFAEGVNPEGDEVDEDEYIELITYVDAKHNIIGRELRSDDAEDVPFVYYTVTSGENFAYKAAGEGYAITGTGTKKNDVTNATYKLNVGGTDYLTMEYKDCKATEKELTGDIRLEPTAQLLSQIFGSTSGLPFADLALDIKLATDGIQLKVMGNDALIVGLDMKVKEAAAGTIELPSNAVDVNDSQAIQTWASEMNLQALLDNLEAAGVPAELIGMIMGGIG